MRLCWEDDGNVIVRKEVCICERTLIVGNRSKVCKIRKLLIDVPYHTTLFICLTMFMASGDTTTVYVVVKYITTAQPTHSQDN